MSEILPGVHHVPAADGTFVYLVKDKGAGWTLIDTGLPGSEAPIAEYLRKAKIEPSAIKRILITHLHRDHTGGLKRMIALTHARTFSHWIEAAYINGEPAYDGPGMPPVESVAIDETFKDGDVLDAAGGLTAFHTPGHTPGHTVFYQSDRKTLFCGDLFFGNESKLILTVPEYSHHVPTATISARRIGQLAVEAVLPYHGGVFPKGGGRLLRQLVDTL